MNFKYSAKAYELMSLNHQHFVCPLIIHVKRKTLKVCRSFFFFKSLTRGLVMELWRIP